MLPWHFSGDRVDALFVHFSNLDDFDVELKCFDASIAIEIIADVFVSLLFMCTLRLAAPVWTIARVHDGAGRMTADHGCACA